MKTAHVELTTTDLLSPATAGAMRDALRAESLRTSGALHTFTIAEAEDAEELAGEIMGTLAERGIDWQTLTVRAGGLSVHYYPSNRSAGMEVAA